MKRVLRTTMMALLVMMLLVSMMAPAALAAYEPVRKTLTVTVDMVASPAEGVVSESDVIPVTVKALDGALPLSVNSYNVNCVGNGSTGTGSVDITFGDYTKPGIYTYGITIGKSSCTDLTMNDELTHYVVILSVVNKDDYSGLEIKVGIREAELVDGEYRYDESGLNKPDALTASKTYAAPMTITLSKRWPNGGKQPVTFYLYEVIENPTEDLNDDGRIDEKDSRKKVNEVVLNADNNWQHKFKTTSDGKLLDSRKEYVLDEKDVPGYHESYHYNKDDALNWIVGVVNRKSLYQTGQLNWPIPVLVCCGSMFMIAGVVMLRKKSIRMDKRRLGFVFVVIGAVLMVSALLLFLYNTIEAKKAGDASNEALSSLRDVIAHPVQSEMIPEEAVEEHLTTEDTVELSEPKALESVEIDGYSYIGYLSIPAFELELPVMAQISEDRLYKAPCLETGSPITDDCVIAGHNYKYHFLPLHNIQEGEKVTFTYMNGYVVEYAVSLRTIVDPTDIPAVHDSEHDLVMYTCTSGGADRVAVYCDRVAASEDSSVS